MWSHLSHFNKTELRWTSRTGRTYKASSLNANASLSKLGWPCGPICHTLTKHSPGGTSSTRRNFKAIFLNANCIVVEARLALWSHLSHFNKTELRWTSSTRRNFKAFSLNANASLSKLGWPCGPICHTLTKQSPGGLLEH